MGRSPRSPRENFNRGAWTTEEDRILRDYIQIHGEGGWNWVRDKAGLNRSGKSCRLRWMNYLRPNIKRGNISSDEDELIIRLHRLLGNRWSLIAGRLPGRTDNEIKNYWNSHLKKEEIGTVNGRERIESKIAVVDLVQEKQIFINENNAGPATDGHQIVRPTAVRCSRTVIDPETNSVKSNHVQTFDGKGTTLFDFDSIAKDFSQSEALVTVDHSNSLSSFSLSEEMEILLLKHNGHILDLDWNVDTPLSLPHSSIDFQIERPEFSD